MAASAPPRIALLGVGGIGGWLGSRLMEAGKQVAEVVLIARGEHGAAIRERGLRLNVTSVPDGAVTAVQSAPGAAEVYSSIEEALKQQAKPVDYILLGVKTWQVRDAAAQCKPFLAPGGCVITTQNGVEAPLQAADALGHRSVVASSLNVLAYIDGPGVVSMKAVPSKMAFGEAFAEDGSELTDPAAAESPRTARLLQALRQCKGVTSEIAPHGAWPMIWEKALLMCCIGPLGAVTRASLDMITTVPETRALWKAAITEVAECAEAKGHLIKGKTVEQAVQEVMDRMTKQGQDQPGVTQSTLRDVVTGKPSEINELSGGIIRAGASVGVPTPTHNFMLAALLPQELRARGEKKYSLMGVPGGAPHVQPATPSL